MNNTKRETPSRTIARLDKFIDIAQVIKNGLNGKPFHWGEGERAAYTKKCASMGITLRTKTWMKNNGYRLKRNAKPVGYAYFGYPISNYGDLYVIECQAVKLDSEGDK